MLDFYTKLHEDMAFMRDRALDRAFGYPVQPLDTKK